MDSKLIRSILGVCFLVLVKASVALAQVDVHPSAVLRGPFTNNSSNVVASDDKYGNASINWNTITDLSIQNSVCLSIDESTLIKTNFDYTVSVQVDYYNGHSDNGSPTGSVTIPLHVVYNMGQPNQNVKSQLSDTYNFTGAYKIVATVKNVPTGAGLPDGANIKLTACVTIDRQYLFQPQAPLYTTVSLDNATDPKNNNVNVSWTTVTGAEQYDLEWTTINSGNDNYYQIINQTVSPNSGIAGVLDQTFRNNATRITTDAQSFSFPLVTSDDYLLVRIRQTQFLNGVKQMGDWNYMTGSNGQYAIIPVSQTEPTLNWQYSTAFAEDGKSKSVISYFDGSLRNRQTVTLNNTDNVAVAQESILDEFGKTVASILPAPHKEDSQTSPYLHYIKGLNLNINNQPYSYLDLQVSGMVCNINPGALSTSNGASKYYSGNNPFLTSTDKSFNKYIPDAQYYPLSVTQYTDDNTGRIKLQGGVGAAFQPGGQSTANSQQNKVTQYFYAVPAQWELDQLFGNDVGYAEHYLKNMVVDPNGQASISYLNSSGKTIATALAGDLPGTMTDLDSHAAINAPNTGQLLLLKPEQFTYNSTDLKLTASTTYLATTTGPRHLEFDMQKMIVHYNDSKLPLCTDCYYKLKVSITDACGVELVPDLQGNTLVSGKMIGFPQSDCTSNATGNVPSVIDVTFANLGEYHMRVELAYDKDVIQAYADTYMHDGPVYGAFPDRNKYIQQNYLDNLDASGCYSDCHTCMVLLGDEPTFEQQMINKFNALKVDPGYVGSVDFHNWVVGRYTQLYNACAALQSACHFSPCSDAQKDMLADVSPGGQYALFNNQFIATEPEVNVLTKMVNSYDDGTQVFTFPSLIPQWRAVFHQLPSTDPLYQSNLITLDDGTVTSPYDAAFYQSQLITYWKPEWANLFLKFHPEYCKYQFCQDMEPYTTWDYQLNAVVKASDVGTVATGLSYSANNSSDWLLNGDAFFNLSDCADYKNQMRADLVSYSQNVLGIPASSAAPQGLMAFIDNILYCTSSTGVMPSDWRSCAPSDACRLTDKEWANYKEYYFQQKQKYYDLLRAHRCPGCTIGLPLTLSLPGSVASGSDFSIKTLSVPDPANPNNNTTVIYNPGKVTQAMTVTLYYPTAVIGTPNLTFTLNFNIGDSQQNFVLPANVSVNDIHVQDVQLTPVTNTANQVYVRINDAPINPTSFSCTDNSNVTTIYNRQMRRTSITLTDASNTNVLVNNRSTDMHIAINYYHTLGSNSSTYNSVFTIHPGESISTATFDYAVVNPNNPIPSYCGVQEYYQIGCVTNLDGAGYNFGNPPRCDGQPPVAPANTPCSVLAVKIPRFQDAPVFDPTTITAANRSAILNNNSLAAQAASACTDNADRWIASLTPGLTSISASPALTDQLRSALIEVCSAGGDQSHPTGVSALSAVGSPSASPNNYTSFGDVIAKVLLPSNSGKFTALLNPWLINGPYPFDSPQEPGLPVASISGAVSSRIQYLEQQAATANLSLFDYLTSVYGSAMILSLDDLTLLQSVAHNTTCTSMLTRNVTLPVFMDVPYKGLVTASEYLAAKTDFTNQFNPALDPADPNYQNILTNYMNYRWGFTLGNYDYQQYETRIAGNVNAPDILYNQFINTPAVVDNYACVKSLVESAVVQGNKAYDDFLIAERARFISTYISTCNLAQQTLHMDPVTEKIYHYTLYYYDQADNLVRTVPPAGVNILDVNTVPNVQAARLAGTGFIYPNHTLTTDYVYNSTNQVIQQHSPDGGLNNFWYDVLSRLSISQNDKQFQDVSAQGKKNYSYTTYDPVLGRITEVGQRNIDYFPFDLTTSHTYTLPMSTLYNSSGNAFVVPDYMSNDAITAFLTSPSGTNSQITHTYYDDVVPAGNGIKSVVQNNLRKRVSASTYQELASDPVQQATYYNYDLDGNVQTLYQQINGLPDPKQIDYEYDLVSGKVNFVRYQDGKPDQFYYKYDYDADNRLTDAWSGTHAIVDLGKGSSLLTFNSRQDAHYDYYLHGPLARMELGDNKVQGVDYAYTLQGWLKGVNSTNLSTSSEMGHDGLSGNLHSTSGQDIYGYALHYYNNDYTAVGGSSPFVDGMSVSSAAGYVPLFNGNIAGSSVNISLPSTVITPQPLLYIYGYDRLNRLTRQDAFSGLNANNNTWTPALIHKTGNNLYGDYHEDASYDPNGNIKTYNRNAYNVGTGNSNTNKMDALTYGYNKINNQLSNNQLRFITDAAVSNYGGVDLQSQPNSQNSATVSVESQPNSADNYKYDAIGNLISDNDPTNLISAINWSVYGKIKSITKASGNISYTYDAAGHRVTKLSGGVTTYYVRDAQGNPLAIYDNANNTVNWREQQLYGSSRLGLWRPNIDITQSASTVQTNADLAWNTVGNKNYELTNHLGNVLATITDRKLQYTSNTTTLDHYTAEVVTAQDYYPFGMVMPGRNFTATVTKTVPGTNTVPTQMPVGYQHSFNNGPYNYPYAVPPEVLDSHLSGSSWTNSNPPSGGMWTTYTGNASSKALGLSSSSPATSSITLTFQIASGYHLILRSYNFNQRSSSTGYQNYNMTINGTNVNGSNNAIFVDGIGQDHVPQLVGGTSGAPVTFPDLTLTGTVNVVINLSNATGNGTFKIDNFVLNGIAQPDNPPPTTVAVSAGNYRYGFNGKENDNDVKGVGEQQDYGMRIYDPRLGRFLSEDPLSPKYPWYTPYQFAGNNPVKFVDLDGLEEYNLGDVIPFTVALIKTTFYDTEHAIINVTFKIVPSDDGKKWVASYPVKDGQEVFGTIIHQVKREGTGKEMFNSGLDALNAFVPAKTITSGGSLDAVLTFTKTESETQGTRVVQKVEEAVEQTKSAKHHIATNKNLISTARGGPWTPKFAGIFKRAGLDINKGSENLVEVINHVGPHPEEYHALVLERLNTATSGLKPYSPEYKEAVVKALNQIGKEAQTQGSVVNKMLTKK